MVSAKRVRDTVDLTGDKVQSILSAVGQLERVSSIN